MANGRQYKPKKYKWMSKRVHLRWDTVGLSTGADYADSLYIDVAQCLSIINRKLVAQGQVFNIKNFHVFSEEADTDDFRLKIATLPHNWVTRNAWVKGKAMFDTMNEMALSAGSQNMLPKWHDYKIYFNDAHRQQGFTETSSTGGSATLPRDADGNIFPVGEWIYSSYHDSGSTSDQFYAHMIGDHSGSYGAMTSVSLCKAYAESRNRVTEGPTQLNVVENSPWFKLFGDDDQTSDAVDSMQADNDVSPYDLDEYIGATSADGGEVVVTTRLQEGNIPMVAPQIPRSFTAPCGLVRVEVDALGNEGTIGTVFIGFEAEVLVPMDA